MIFCRIALRPQRILVGPIIVPLIRRICVNPAWSSMDASHSTREMSDGPDRPKPSPTSEQFTDIPAEAAASQSNDTPVRLEGSLNDQMDEKHTYSRKDVKGDLFVFAGDTASLAHCVSVDLRMGKGIAVAFKNKFGGVNELQAQNPKIGGVVQLKRGRRFVYYLITKARYSDKPTYDSLRASLHSMKDHCVKNSVRDLMMPRIGCGLDRLEYAHVGPIIDEVFGDTNINITVCFI